MNDEEKKERILKYAGYICLFGFVATVAYIFFAAFEGLWPYSIIGYAPLYIKLISPFGFYFLYWLAIILLVLGLSFQKRSKEIIIFVFCISLALFIIIIVGGMLPPV